MGWSNPWMSKIEKDPRILYLPAEWPTVVSWSHFYALLCVTVALLVSQHIMPMGFAVSCAKSLPHSSRILCGGTTWVNECLKRLLRLLTCIKTIVPAKTWICLFRIKSDAKPLRHVPAMDITWSITQKASKTKYVILKMEVSVQKTLISISYSKWGEQIMYWHSKPGLKQGAKNGIL